MRTSTIVMMACAVLFGLLAVFVAQGDRMVGRGGNYIQSGRTITVRRETPMCNLFITMMDRMGVHVEHFGDSTGKVEGLDLA